MSRTMKNGTACWTLASGFVAVAALSKSESLTRSDYNEVRGAFNSQALGVDAQVIILVRAPIALPVQPYPLIALLIRVVDEPRCVFGAHTFALHGAGDQRFAGSVTEYVKGVFALCQHLLRTASDDDDRTARDCFFYDVARDFNQLLVRRTLGRVKRGHPLL